jgi:hypothetical protein
MVSSLSIPLSISSASTRVVTDAVQMVKYQVTSTVAEGSMIVIAATVVCVWDAHNTLGTRPHKTMHDTTMSWHRAAIIHNRPAWYHCLFISSLHTQQGHLRMPCQSTLALFRIYSNTSFRLHSSHRTIIHKGTVCLQGYHNRWGPQFIRALQRTQCHHSISRAQWLLRHPHQTAASNLKPSFRLPVARHIKIVQRHKDH